MTSSAGRKMTVYLPGDVAAVVEAQGKGKASSYIADAVRMMERRKATQAMLREAGYLVTPEGIQRMRERVRNLEAQRAARQ